MHFTQRNLVYRVLLSFFTIAKVVADNDLNLINSNCLSTSTVMNDGLPARCSFQIIFKDDFTSNSLDMSKWNKERRFASKPDYEFVMYLDDNPDMWELENSTFKLKPKRTTDYFHDISRPLHVDHNLGLKCTGLPNTEECELKADRINVLIPPFVSSQVTTKGKFSFKYGRVEVRAKLPKADWVFPQIWLQPVDQKYGNVDYQSGQMRIAFSRTNGNDMELFAGIILNAAEPWRSAKLCKKPISSVFGENFHTYKMLWTENLLTFAVDNEEYCRIQVSGENDAFSNFKIDGKSLPNKGYLQNGTPLAPFDQEFYITLGYGIGGFNDFPDDLYEWKNQKPWENFHPRAMKKLWNAYKNKFDEWLANGDFIIDYIKVFSV